MRNTSDNNISDERAVLCKALTENFVDVIQLPVWTLDHINLLDVVTIEPNAKVTEACEADSLGILDKGQTENELIELKHGNSIVIDEAEELESIVLEYDTENHAYIKVGTFVSVGGGDVERKRFCRTTFQKVMRMEIEKEKSANQTSLQQQQSQRQQPLRRQSLRQQPQLPLS